MIKIDRSEIIEAIRYTTDMHGKATTRQLRHQFHDMAKPKTEHDKLEAKVNAGLKRKHGQVFVITRGE